MISQTTKLLDSDNLCAGGDDLKIIHYPSPIVPRAELAEVQEPARLLCSAGGDDYYPPAFTNKREGWLLTPGKDRERPSRNTSTTARNCKPTWTWAGMTMGRGCICRKLVGGVWWIR